MKTIEQIRAFALMVAPWVIGMMIILGITMVLPKMSYNYANSKAIVVEIGMAIVIALGLISIPWSAFKKLLTSKIVWGISAFVGVSLVATLLSMDPTISWLSHMERGMGTFFLVAVSVGSFFSVAITSYTDTFRKSVLYPVAISGMVVAVSTILGFTGLNISKALVLSEVSRGGGLTGNSSFAGTVLMMTFFVSIYLLVTTKDTWKKWALGIFGVLTIFSPIMFGYQMFKFGLPNLIGIIGDAKGATISLGLGLLVALGVYLAYSQSKVRTWLGKILAGGIIASAILGIVLLSFPKSPVYKIFVEQTTSARFIYWGMAMDSFKDHPVLGTGPETYRYASERYFNPTILRPSYGEEIWADKPHNSYLEILATTGILGAVAYLFMIGAVVWTLIRLGKRQENKKIVAIFSGLVFAYLLNNFILFDIPSSYTILFLLLIWLGKEEVSGIAPDKTPWSGWNIALRALGGALIIVGVLVVVIPTITKLKRVLGEMYAPIETRIKLYQYSEDASSFGSGLSLAQRADVYSQSYMNNISVVTQGSEADKKLILSDIESLSKVIMNSFEKYPQSTQSLTALGRLASVKVAVLNRPDAEALKQMSYAGSEIIRLAPKNLQGYWILGQVAIYQQNYEEALRLFKRGLAIDPKVPTSYVVIMNLAKLTNNQALLAETNAAFDRNIDIDDRKQWSNGLIDPL